MKVVIAIVAAFLVASVNAQNVGEVQEGAPWLLSYDHDLKFASAIYLNGSKATNFTISQITVTTNAVPSGSTNAQFSFKVNMAPLARGQYRVTATVFDESGIESDQSLPLNIKAKPRPPWYLRLF